MTGAASAAAALVVGAGSIVAPGPLPSAALTPTLWVLAGLSGLNTVGNLAGRHPVERWVMSAVTAALTVLYVAVAIAG